MHCRHTEVLEKLPIRLGAALRGCETAGGGNGTAQVRSGGTVRDVRCVDVVVRELRTSVLLAKSVVVIAY
jgi:hypothetical protein